MKKSSIKKVFSGLLFLVLSLVSITAFAEVSSWTLQTTFTSHGYLYYIASSSDGSTLVAVTNTGGSGVWIGVGCGTSSPCTSWTLQSGITNGVPMASVAIDAAGDKMVAVAASGDVYVGTSCSGGTCGTWTDQGSGPGSHSWQEVSMSSDGSIIAVDGTSTDVWIGTGCTSGTCTWHDQGATPGNQAWRAMAMSSDGSKIATAINGGDIWIGTGCTSGTCSTWTDQGTGAGEPGVQSWRSLSFSSDGSELAGAVVGGDLWIGTNCTSGTCSSWTNQTTNTGASWYAVALSSDGTKLAASQLGGDIWLGYNCNTGLCTWTDQGTSPFGGTQPWRGIASSSDGTKVVSVIDGASTIVSYLWTGVVTYPPTLATGSATSITQTSATLNGSITSSLGANATVRGFNWGLTSGYGTTTVESGSFSTGSFTASISGLACNTTYHYQAYATNPGGTGTSSPDATFTTTPCVQTLTTSSPTSVTSSSAILNGNITATGGANASIEGFNYGPTTSYGSTVSLTGSFSTGAYNIALPGTLTCATLYHYRSFATNVSGTGTSSDATFTTSACPTTTATVTWSGGHGSFAASVPSQQVVAPTTTQQASVAPIVTIQAPSSLASSFTFTRTLRQGMTGTDVTNLQKFLVSQGYLKTNVFGYFGNLTKAAVIKFQNANASTILTPQGLTVGTGVFGVATRNFVNQTMAR